MSKYQFPYKGFILRNKYCLLLYNRYILYIILYNIYNIVQYLCPIHIPKIFRRKDITLTRNRVIRICIQNTLVPPIAGYF